MLRYLISCLIILVVIGLSAAIFFPHYWVHRYDDLIIRQSRIYDIDQKLVWSLIYEESYFKPWAKGAAGEVGLMQITPAVARKWGKETGLKEFERQVNENTDEYLLDPEQNIQVGCWYLENVRDMYRGRISETAMALAAYNAGPSRVDEWTKGTDAASMTEADFISRILIPSTRNYVSSILARYRSDQGPQT